MNKISRVTYRILYGDTDCGGVVYYGTYLRLFEIGRTELLRNFGITYRELEEQEKILLPVVEAYIRYRAPAKYDDLVEIRTKLTDLKPYKVCFHYEIYRNNRLITEGFTVHAPITQEGRLTKFPVHILQKLKSLLYQVESENQ